MILLETLLLLIYLGAFSYALLTCSCFKIPQARPKLIMALWGYKVLAGVFFYLIFTFYQPYSHGSDSAVYFQDGIVLAKVAKESPKDYIQLLLGTYSDETQFLKYTSKIEYWNRSYPSVIPNDNRIVIRINSLFSFISFGFYSVHLLFMAFLSFIGLLLIYKATSLFFLKTKKMLILAIFTIPSTVFWSAGNLKEPLLVFFLGCFIFGLTKVSMIRSFRNSALILMATFFLIYTKPYILVLILPVSISFVLVQRFHIKKTQWIYFSVFAILGNLILGISHFFPSYSIAQLLTTKQIEFISMVTASQSGSAFSIPPLDGTFLTLFLNAPTALVNSLSRPWIWEPENWTQLLAALENLVIIGIAFLLAIRFRFAKIAHSNIALFSFFLGIQLFILAGLITPNMGALVRYKSIGLPFLFMALLAGWSLADKNGKELFSQDLFKRGREKIRNYFWFD